MLDFHFHLARFMARTVENNIFLEIFKKKKKKKKKKKVTWEKLLITGEASYFYKQNKR